MRLGIWGVIAITSAMTFACTTTTTETTTSSGSEPTPAESEFHAKLARSKSGNAAAISALSKKTGGSKPATPWNGKGGGKCGLSSGDATCDTCLDTSCCSQNQACVNDADCSALIACGNACTDETCFQNCFSSHPTGAAKLDTLMTCVETSCTTACGGGPSGSPSACGFGSGDAKCDSCLDTNCCGDANACLGDADCIALLDCAYLCNDNACIAACEAKHPSGATKLNALSSCANNKCGTTCGGGGGGGGGPPPPGSCGLTSGVATCDACLDGSCCAQTTTCINDADCIALVDCYNTCNSATCAAACDTSHPTGKTKLDSVLTCAQTSCGKTCGF